MKNKGSYKVKFKSRSQLKDKMKQFSLKQRYTDTIKNINPFSSFDNFLDDWLEYINDFDFDTYKNWIDSYIGLWSIEDIEENIIKRIPSQTEQKRRLKEIRSLKESNWSEYLDTIIKIIEELSSDEKDEILKKLIKIGELGDKYDIVVKSLNRKIIEDQNLLKKEFPAIQNPIEIYRGVNKDNVEDIRFGSGEHISWSWNKDSAEPPSGRRIGGKNMYVLTAVVSRDGVNWKRTILASTSPSYSDENEIFQDLSKPILVTNIEIKTEDKEYEPVSHSFQLPLKTD